MKNYNSTSLSCWQPCNSGLDGFQSTNHDISMMVDSNVNGYLGAGFDDFISDQLAYGSVEPASQFSCFSPVMYSSLMSTPIDNLGLASIPRMVDYQWNLPCDSMKNDTLLVQPCKTIKDVRKCVNGARLAQRSSTINNTTSLDSRTSKKRKEIEQFIDAQKQLKMHAPVKRSQKLTDKITALQELVSPYGKTDTASVLHEACIFIKIIHQELRRLSISYFEGRSLSQLQGDAERQCDLQSRGLCLVPVSIMKSLTRESWSDQHQTASRTSRRHGNTKF